MRRATKAALALAMTSLAGAATADPPPILQLTIEAIRPGMESHYGAIEEELARLCARLACPNAYLALKSLDAPEQVWWLVSYQSQADVERVAAAYASNQPLLDAMNALTAKKTGAAEAPTELWTTLRADLSEAAPWRVGTTPFAVIATGSGGGTVFETSDGRRFTFAALDTAAAAAETAARLGGSARVFEVRPRWSRPETGWIVANPDLWAGQ